MSKTFKMIRLVGVSDKSYEQAIENAIIDAGETIRNLNWFQVVEQRGGIGDNNKVREWQVVVDVAFRIEKP
jgi:flavin-binding protein dodecin